MAEESDSGCSFIIEELRWDDPRLRRFFEIPEAEKQSSFHATIQLLPGPDDLEIEDVNFWNHCNLTADDFKNLQSVGLKGKLRVTGGELQGTPRIGLEHSLWRGINLERRLISHSRIIVRPSTIRLVVSGEAYRRKCRS